MSTSLIRGVDPNGNVRTVAVDEEGRVLIAGGGDGSSGGDTGGGDASAAMDEIKDAVGSKGDQTAHSLSGYYGFTPWSIVSLIRGIFSKLELITNGYISFFTNAVITSPVQTYPVSNSLTDFSGVIQNPNESFIAVENPNRRWLLLQNIGKIDPQTGLYEGDLWVNIGFVYDPNSGTYNIPSATVGHKSYRLRPGETMNFEGSVLPYGGISLLGTIAGIEYTLKVA